MWRGPVPALERLEEMGKFHLSTGIKRNLAAQCNPLLKGEHVEPCGRLRYCLTASF